MADELRCDDGTCVGGYARCNLHEDCPDASDEKACPAPAAVVASPSCCASATDECEWKKDDFCDRGCAFGVDPVCPPDELSADCCGDPTDPCSWRTNGTCESGCAWGEDPACLNDYAFCCLQSVADACSWRGDGVVCDAGCVWGADPDCGGGSSAPGCNDDGTCGCGESVDNCADCHGCADDGVCGLDEDCACPDCTSEPYCRCL